MKVIELPKTDDDKVNWGPSITWEQVANWKTPSEGELRFTLYEDGEDKKTTCVFIDVDGVPQLSRKILASLIPSGFAGTNYVTIDSGNGVHIYFPLDAKDYLSSDDHRQYKAAYLMMLKEVKKRISSFMSATFTAEFDEKVFSPKKLGRLPRSINRKGGGRVKVLGSKFNGHNFDIGLWRKTELPTRPKIDCSTEQYTRVARGCGIVKALQEGQIGLSHNSWYKVMNLYSIIGASDKGVADSTKRLEKEDTTKMQSTLNALDNSNSKPVYTCDSYHYYFQEAAEESPCTKCPHLNTGSSPHEVSGLLPTPTRGKDFQHYS